MTKRQVLALLLLVIVAISYLSYLVQSSKPARTVWEDKPSERKMVFTLLLNEQPIASRTKAIRVDWGDGSVTTGTVLPSWTPLNNN